MEKKFEIRNVLSKNESAASITFSNYQNKTFFLREGEKKKETILIWLY